MLCLAMGLLPIGTFAGELGACFRGINLSGAEFGEIGGQIDRDYAYPSDTTIRYFADKGFNTVRLPFRWERLQPRLNQALDPAELARLEEAVARLRAAGLRVILDAHNYARYGGRVVDGRDLPAATLADFWARLALRFGKDVGVSFGLMNEPHDLPARMWLPVVNETIAAIRATGARNLVLVPGVAWTGAHSWESEAYGGANGTVMLEVRDPADHFAFEVHQYLDRDFSGTHATCDRAEDAVAAVQAFTRWLRHHDRRGYLGEFGASGDPACVAALGRIVGSVEDHRDLWVGWSYWVAGDWWPASEPLNIQPGPSGDRPQLRGLSSVLKDFSAASAECRALR